MHDQMRGVAARVCAAQVGQLPKRRAGHQAADADGGVEGDDVLQVGKPASRARVIVVAARSSSRPRWRLFLVTVTSSPPGRSSVRQPAYTARIPTRYAGPRLRPRLAGWRE